MLLVLTSIVIRLVLWKIFHFHLVHYLVWDTFIAVKQSVERSLDSLAIKTWFVFLTTQDC